MISYYTIITFLLFHWIFDFHLQTDEMSKQKSSNNSVLIDHIAVYSIGLLLMASFNINYFSGWWFSAFIIVNAVFHFLTDWVTSRATSLLYKDERYHDFFVVIGADQMIHYITLFGTFIWLSSL